MNEEIKTVVDILRKGGVILYPTDTIWGLGCDATNDEAVKKIYAIKQRTDEKSMLVLLDTADKLPDYVATVPDIAYNIIEVTYKPITIIYPGAQQLAESLVAGDGSIGIRITKDDFCSRLIHALRKPLVSTSANISGKPWPADFSKIDPEIIRCVDYVVKFRQDDKKQAKPSGIIKLGINGEVKVIRE